MNHMFFSCCISRYPPPPSNLGSWTWKLEIGSELDFEFELQIPTTEFGPLICELHI